MIALEIPGEPVAFARAGSNGKHRFTKPKQANYGNLIKMIAAQRMLSCGVAIFEGPVCVMIRAEYHWPRSWSTKRKDATRWKTSKPDADNILKIAKDAMSGIVYRDDALVVDAHVQKSYSATERLLITVMEAPI